MLHQMDENKADEDFDEGQYPLLDWKENTYELFAIIYSHLPGKFVAYVLKEEGTQWYLIQEDQFKTCEKDEIDELTQPQMQFFRKKNVKNDFADKLEQMMKLKNKDLGVTERREVTKNINNNLFNHLVGKNEEK